MSQGKILLLCRYGPKAASTRHRLLQYIPYLQDHGFEVQVETLLDDAYLDRLYAGQRPSMSRIARSYVQRLLTLVRAGHYDLIWTYIEAFPWVPGFLESILVPGGVPYVVDYDDAMFHRYDRHRLPLVRSLLGTKLDRVMRESALVVAGNQYIAERAARAGARTIEVLPTVVDLSRFPVVPRSGQREFTVGWIGSPATAYNLQVVRPALEQFARSHPMRFVAIGSGPIDLGRIPHDVRPWSEGTEVNEIQQFDVGIMPLVDSPFERGKNGFKLIQYMACARPVIASPVGVNQEIVRKGVNGFLAATSDDWSFALEALCDDPLKRARYGEAGRRLVEEHYSLAVAAPKLAEMLSGAISR